MRARASRARSPAERVAPSSPRAVSRPSGRARTRSSSATRRRAAHRVVVVGVVGGQAQVVGDRAGDEDRPLRQPGDLAAARRRRRPRRRRPGWCRPLEREQPGDGVEQRGLAAPGRAGDDGHPAAGMRGVERASSAGTVRPGWATVRPLSTSGRRGRGAGGPGRRRRRRGSSSSVVDRPRTSPRPRRRRGTPRRPGAAASTPRARAAARRSAVCRSSDPPAQPDADGDRDQGDRQGGDELEDGGGGEGDPQGAQRWRAGSGR